MVPDELSGGPYFAAFCERYLRHTKGRWSGRPLVFEDWQREFWWEALEIDPATGLRVYSEIGLGLPRKNGKSTIAAALGLYALVADGENEPEVYVGAGAQQQATIVMGQSLRMARRSPGLASYVKVQKYLIEGVRSGGIMRALASDGGLQHGLNPSCSIIDEVHAHKNDDLYTALTTGTGAREQPLTFWITTAGKDEDDLLASLHDQMFDGPGSLEQRDDSLLIYRDRDTDALEAAMARLDHEEREAREEKVEDGVPADEATAYLKDLGGTWAAADGGEGRKMLAEALFERIEVRGFREVRLHLTDVAIAHGFGAVFPERLAISVSGRGERANGSRPV